MIIGTYALVWLIVGLLVAVAVITCEGVSDDPGFVGFVCIFWPPFLVLFVLLGVKRMVELLGQAVARLPH